MHYKRLNFGLILFSCFLGATSTVFAWGPEGHAIVATIADRRLNDQARAQVADLLGPGVKMRDVASWADEVRSQRSESAPWHYVDIPIDGNDNVFNETRDGQNGNNVIDAINRFVAIMTDSSKPMNDRSEALKFVIHFVGDIHQPLHCSDRGDKGGNTRLVFLLDQPTALNLHRVWDSGILHLSMGNTPVDVYASGLNARISASQAADWARGTPEDWANESHKIAVDAVYKGVPPDGPPPKLTQDYVDANEKVIDQQLERAGVRLAMVLNANLGGAAATQPGGNP